MQIRRKQLSVSPRRARPWPARRAALLACAILIGAIAAPMPAAAQFKKRYDKQLLRLSEILGAVHYLRELCGSDDKQTWRKAMEDLLKAEGYSAQRRLLLTKEFNKGYRAYARTYSKCTPSAKTSISRFINEGAKISDTMVRKIR